MAGKLQLKEGFYRTIPRPDSHPLLLPRANLLPAMLLLT